MEQNQGDERSAPGMTRRGFMVSTLAVGFALAAGLLFVIRVYNPAYPEGCSFAILFMNVLTPLIDKLTVPKPFGFMKPAKPVKANGASAPAREV